MGCCSGKGDELTMEKEQLKFASEHQYDMISLIKMNRISEIESWINEKKWRVNYQMPTFSRRTILHIAAKEGNFDLCQKLLEHEDPADINAQDILGITPIMLAMQNKHYKLVKMFANMGADINLRTTRHTDLSDYVQQGDKEGENLLLQIGFRKKKENEIDFGSITTSS